MSSSPRSAPGRWSKRRSTAMNHPPPRSRTPLRAGIAVLAAAAIAGFALTPAGADVREWIADTIDSAGEEDAEPRLTSLPTPGSVLVRGAQRGLGHPRRRLQAPPWRLRPGDVVAERPVRWRRRRLGAPGDRPRRELPLVDRGRRAGEGDRLVVRRRLPGRLPRWRRAAGRHGRRSHGPRGRAGSGRTAGVATRVRSG